MGSQEHNALCTFIVKHQTSNISTSSESEKLADNIFHTCTLTHQPRVVEVINNNWRMKIFFYQFGKQTHTHTPKSIIFVHHIITHLQLIQRIIKKQPNNYSYSFISNAYRNQSVEKCQQNVVQITNKQKKRIAREKMSA